MQSIRVHLDRGIVKAQGRHAAIGKLYVARRADRRVYLEMTLAARSRFAPLPPPRRRCSPSPTRIDAEPNYERTAAAIPPMIKLAGINELFRLISAPVVRCARALLILAAVGSAPIDSEAPARKRE